MPIGRFSLVAIDCPDPDQLAAFSSAITGWTIELPEWADPELDGRRWLQLRGRRTGGPG